MLKSTVTTLAATIAMLSMLSTAHAGSRADTSEDKSASEATMYAVSGTLLPLAIAGAALAVPSDGRPEHDAQRDLLLLTSAAVGVIGPSAGNLYAQDGASGLKGTAVRGSVMIGITSVVMVRDVVRALQKCHSFPDGGECSADFPPVRTPKLDAVLTATSIVGGAAVVTSIVWDIATAGRHARESNAARHARNVSIAPTVVSTGATPTAGISLGGTF